MSVNTEKYGPAGGLRRSTPGEIKPEISGGHTPNHLCIALPSNKRELRCAVAPFLIELFQPKIKEYFLLELDGKEFANCNIIVKQPKEETKNDGSTIPDSEIGKALHSKLKPGIESYAYGTIPKTLVQRLSASATASRVYELLAGFSAIRGKNNDEALRAFRANTHSLDMIEGHPFVIGFGGARSETPEHSKSPEHSKTPQPAKLSERARFGWVIAPRLKALAAEYAEGIRQPNQQYTLSAVVSLPSWWQTVELSVRWCWLSRDELKKELDQGPECRTSRREPYLVKLPGRPDELSRKLGVEVLKTPFVEPGQLWFLTVGLPGQLIIEGLRLWRSTVVTVDSQEADEIMVLPNMKGIVAKFDCVRRPENRFTHFDQNNNAFPAKLRVWTSEGMVSTGDVQLLPPSGGRPPKPQPPDQQESNDHRKTQPQRPGQADRQDASAGHVPHTGPDPTLCPDDKAAELNRSWVQQRSELEQALQNVRDKLIRELGPQAKTKQ